MNKQSATPLIAPAKEQVKRAFPQYSELIDDTPVYLIPSRNALKRRNEIAEELGAPIKESFEDTAGETIIGNGAFAIVMLYDCIRDYDFTHFLLHEFGHVISCYANASLFAKVQADCDNDRDTPLTSASCLWSEFIAEVIAYRIEDAPPKQFVFDEADKMERLADEALCGKIFQSYPFAHFCAMFFADPSVQDYLYDHQCAAIGMNHLDDDVMPLVKTAMDTLFNQIDKDVYWIIDEPDMRTIGECVDDLWEYCSNRRLVKGLKALVSNASKPGRKP